MSAQRPPLTAGRGTRNEGTRQHNLSTLVSLVHHSGGASRAELTRLTGLNRSTVGTLVADLATARLVFEDEPEVTGAGRPSPVVRPAADVAVLAVNPDIDAVEVGLIGLGGRVIAHDRRELSAPPEPEAALAIAAEMWRALADEHLGLRLLAAGIAVPGLVRTAGGLVVRAPHLRWHDVDLADAAVEAFQVPTVVRNDARASVVAESIFGAGRGVSDLLYFNGSASGIGGGAVVDGSVLVGADGFAGEFGHTLVNPGGEVCHCGRTGCLETEVNMQRQQAAADAGTLDAELDRQASYLGRGMGNVVSAFNPSSVVLGGFLADLLAARGEEIAASLRGHAFAPMADEVSVVPALLGDDRVLVGVAELALRPLLADPLAQAS